MNEFQKQLKALKVVPVVTPYSVESTLKMTEAMAAGGIGSVEITLRTDCAWEAIAAVKEAGFPVQVGVGTVTNAETMTKAIDIKADFVVSPGITPDVLETAKASGIAFLPGIATASELMYAMSFGYSTFKIFPAMAINAPALLSSFAGPFPEVMFCPTGGVNLDNAPGLLQRDNVVCVGGSWMIPKDLVQAGDWAAITELSRAAMAL